MGYSPSGLLNLRQIHTENDILLPSPAHAVQVKQPKEVTKSQQKERVAKRVIITIIEILSSHGTLNPVVTESKWIPAIVIKCRGPKTFYVPDYPHGPIWRRHVNLLKLRHICQKMESQETTLTKAEQSISSSDCYY